MFLSRFKTKDTGFKLTVMAVIVAVLVGVYTMAKVFGETIFNATITTNADLENGLVGHWTFDGKNIDWSSSTAEILDRGSFGNNGDANFTQVASHPGRIGQGMNLDGSDDIVIMNGTEDMYESVPMAVSAWFKLDELPSTRSESANLVYKRHSSGPFFGSWDLYVTTSDDIRWGMTNSANSNFALIDSDAPAVAGEWYHVVGVAQSNYDLQLYINGILQSGSDNPGSIFDSNLPLALGAFNSTPGNAHIDGIIDDVRIYNRALSQKEITRLYSLGATTEINTTINTNPALENGLIAHYTFDGSGISTSSILDRSGNNNDGTLYILNSGVSVVTAVANSGTTGDVTNTFSVDAGSGSGRYMIVQYAIDVQDVFDSYTFTYAGADLTPLIQINGDIEYVYALYGLEDPASGTNDLVVNWNGLGSAAKGPVIGWAVYGGVENGASASDSIRDSDLDEDFNGTLSLSLAGLTIGDYIVAGCIDDDDISTTANNLTEDFNQSHNSQNLCWGHLEADGTSESVGWSSGTFMAGGGVALKLGAASASESPVIVRPGRIGQSTELNGSSEYIDWGSLGSGVKSIAFWAKIANSTANLTFFDIGNGDKINTNGSSVVTTTSFPGTTNVYIDGSLNNSYTIDKDWHHIVVTDTTGVNASDFTTGTSTSFFGGVLDDVRVYNRVLSANEISRLHSLGATTEMNTTIATNPNLESGLTGHWTFDGDAISTSSVLDRGSGSNNGSFYVNVAASSIASTTPPDFTETTSQNNTIPVDAGTEDNRYLVVFVQGFDFGSAQSVDTITYDGADMAQLDFIDADEVIEGVYGLRNPSSGTNNLVVNFSTTPDVTGYIAWEVLEGVYQGSTSTDAVRDTDTDISPSADLDVSLTGLSAGDYLIAAGGGTDDTGPYTPTSPTIEDIDTTSGDFSTLLWGHYVATGASHTIGFTNSDFGSLGFGVALIPDPGGATLTSASTRPGRIGQGLYFDGTADYYIDLGDLGTGLRTIAFWMKTGSTTQKTINIDGTDQIEVVNGTITATSFPANTIYVDGAQGSTITAGNWHHVVITTSSGVDGSTFELGRVGSNYYIGLLDDVRVYNRVLSASEITRLYQLGS